MRALLLLLELLCVAALWVALRRLAPPRARTPLVFAIKAYLTLRVIWLIALHEVDGMTIYAVLREHLRDLDAATFALYVLLAMGLKLVGIAASIGRWMLMLRGQGIELPARHVVGAFFIGRFLGTFLPSTLGLDGYKLYDAARFSGRTIEVTAATAVEKVLGVSGIFGTFLIALPLGVGIFGSYARVITWLGVPIALLPLVFVSLGFFWPGPVLIRFALGKLPLPTLRHTLARIADGASAYARHKGLLLAAWGLSLVQHFTTASMYYATARALGVTPQTAGFWEVTFASSIQIFATVISPFTIAGEGIREAAQGLLLQGQMSFAVAAASGLLGFLAAEAPTLLGALPWLLRRESYRPAFCHVDGRQVDYEAARRGAADLGTGREAHAAAVDVQPLTRRLVAGARLGLAAGLYAGLAIGIGEALYLLFLGKVVEEAQVLWAAPLAYGVLIAGAGAAGGAVLAALPLTRTFLERWVPALAGVGGFVPFALVAALFFAYRDFHAERMPPLRLIAALAGGFGLLGLILLGLALRIARTRLAGLYRLRVALPLALLCMAGAAAVGAAFTPAPRRGDEGAQPIPESLRARPNVLLVIIDTLRADVLPAYGGRQIRTPALDRLASEGTVFRAAFSHASWTKPAIASILTSLYPSSHGAVLKPSRLPDSVDTIAEAFRALRYATGGIVTNVNLAPSFNFQQGFDEYHYLAPDYLFGAEDSTSRLLLYEIARRIAGRVSGGVRPGQAYQPAEVVNAQASEWLGRRRDERFFLLLHYMDPHDPYFSHPDDGHAIARSANPHPDPALRDEMYRRYLGEVEYLDQRLGELLGELERLGLYDDLLIAVTADHGEEFLDHGSFWHGLTLYDEQIAVPLIIRWPRGERPPGAAAQHPAQVRLIDVAPTLLAYAGAPLPPSMQGESLVGPGAAVRRERAIYAEEDHEGNVLQALRAQGWKLIRANPGNPRKLGELELYRVEADPREEHELAASEGARAQALLRDLGSLSALASTQAREKQMVEIDRDECERLKALGYVEDCGP